MKFIAPINKIGFASAILGVSLVAATTYAYIEQVPVNPWADKLKKEVDNSGKVSYTIDGKVYYSAGSSVSQAQAVAIQRAIERKLNQFLYDKKIIDKSLSVKTQVNSHMIHLSGKISEKSSDKLVLVAGRLGTYEITLPTDTFYFSGDTAVKSDSIKPGSSINVATAVQPTDKTPKDGLNLNRDEAIAYLQTEKLTALAVEILPFDVNDYIDAIFNENLNVEYRGTENGFSDTNPH